MRRLRYFFSSPICIGESKGHPAGSGSRWLSSFRKTSRTTRQEGFTLMEMVITISLLMILLVMSIGALSYYFAGRSVDVASREIIAQIREAQSLAVATGNTYRIDFGAPGSSTYQLQRRQGTEWIAVRDAKSLPGGVSVSSTATSDFGGDLYLELYGKGDSESGQVVIDGRYGKTRTVSVTGETVNVSSS